MGLLDGKVAVVTGAGRGIGRSEAMLLAAEGASVLVNDIGWSLDGSRSDGNPAAEVAAKIVNLGGQAASDVADVSSWSAAQTIVDHSLTTFGRLDILVNNAGNLRRLPLLELEQDEWDSVNNVHARGCVAMAHFAALHWATVGSDGEPANGRIINTVSESGFFGIPGQSAYSPPRPASRL